MQADIILTPGPVARHTLARLRRLLPGLAMAASRGAAVGMQFLVQIAVGGLAGPAGLGLLQLFMSWSCILGEVLALGLPARAMRTTAVNWDRGEAGSAWLELERSASLILKVVAFFALGLLLSLWLIDSVGHASTTSVNGLILLATVFAAPLVALSRLGADALKGSDAALPAIALESLLAPLVILSVCALCWLLAYPLGKVALLLAGLAGFAVTALALWGALQGRLMKVPVTRQKAVSGLVFKGDLAALWATGVLGMAFLHLPILVLPWYAGTDAVGVYCLLYTSDAADERVRV